LSIDADTPFSRAIEEHLSLKKRNAGLDGAMPLDRYEQADPMENHPLFKSEEQARLEETFETMPEEPLVAEETPHSNGSHEPARVPVASTASETPEPPDSPEAPVTNSLPWPGQDEAEGPALDEGLWGKSRDFDWGE
jgi:hypothetical protein